VVDEVRIEWPENEVGGILAGTGGTGIVLAHGAGTDQTHAFMVQMRDGLAARGYRVLTFNYPYSDRGSRRPDQPQRLLACHRAAADFLAAEVDELFLAGRSMGGRIATHLVSEGYPAAGVVLYSYPLHPAGKPEKLRVDHLPLITVPMLFFQGTHDALSRMDLFERHIAPLPGVTVELLDGAGHSFSGGGWTLETMVERLVEGTSTWARAVSSGRSSRRRA
jgi:uncharacterized protein